MNSLSQRQGSRGCQGECGCDEVPIVLAQNSKEQCLRLSNERFAIPELLFHPSDIGINQMGIPAKLYCTA